MKPSKVFVFTSMFTNEIVKDHGSHNNHLLLVHGIWCHLPKNLPLHF
jgi:hypothetical protein